MIHTDGHATIASYGDCPGCGRKTVSKRCQQQLRKLDTGELTEREAVELFAVIVQYDIPIDNHHALLVTAFVDQGYITQDGKVRRYL